MEPKTKSYVSFKVSILFIYIYIYALLLGALGQKNLCRSSFGYIIQNMTSLVNNSSIYYILYRIAMLNKEASSLWPGNRKIHIKGNTDNLLKMEEFLTQKVPECSMPEIGFGRGE